MRLTITYFLLMLMSISCAEISDDGDVTEDIPGHDNYPSGWETDNLKGEIKTLKQYKVYVVNFKTGITDEPLLEFIKTYNSFGNTVKEEFYATFGELEQSFEGSYRADGSQCETVWKTIEVGDKTLTTEKYDTITGLILSSHSIMNDFVTNKCIYAFDEKGNMKQLKTDLNAKDQIVHYEYSSDENDQILSEVQWQERNGKRDTISQYHCEYDSLGNKTEQFNKSLVDFIKDSRIMFEYDTKKRLTTLRHFEDDTLTVVIEYDTLGNELVQKEYQDGTFASQTRIIYNYDNKGNWIKQRVFREEKDSEEMELFVKTREIEYFK